MYYEPETSHRIFLASSATVPYQYLSIEPTVDPQFIWPDTTFKCENFTKISQTRIRIRNDPPGRIRMRNDPPGRIRIWIRNYSFGSATLLEQLIRDHPPSHFFRFVSFNMPVVQPGFQIRIHFMHIWNADPDRCWSGSRAWIFAVIEKNSYLIFYKYFCECKKNLKLSYKKFVLFT